VTRKAVGISSGEASVIADLFHERDLAMKALTAITQLICARENIPVAILAGLDGTSLLLDVPDNPALKLDRTESSQTDLGVLGSVQQAESPANGQSAPALAPITSAPKARNDDLAGDTGHGA
jgi:hypothetical protein